jgi:hypothetical protein
MAQNSRILYINYDSPAPAGGVRTIYYHVSRLIKNGYPAFVVHNQPGFKPSWFEADVPIVYLTKDFKIFPDDIVVIPEDYSAALDAFRNAHVRKYIFCQNHFYVFKGLQGDESWEDFGISCVFCSSEAISEFVSSVFGYDEVPIVHYAIPLDIFKPREKRLQIAYMPRKRATEIDFIKKLFNRAYPQYKEIPWICIDKVEEGKAAQILGESAVFLSTSLYEGFGLPPLEALACGCIVVGFHGYGGLEYVTDNNGFWCEEGNIIECARTLGHVVSLIEDHNETIHKVKQEGLKTAGKYTFDRQEKDLIDFWKRAYE